MTNPNRYDDSMFSEEIDADLVEELIAEGYTHEEALRMVGDYDPDEFDPETCYGIDSLERDIPALDDFIDPEDFE